MNDRLHVLHWNKRAWSASASAGSSFNGVGAVCMLEVAEGGGRRAEEESASGVGSGGRLEIRPGCGEGKGREGCGR